MSRGCLSGAEKIRLAEGLMPPAEAEALDEHVRGCRECARSLSDVREMLRLLRQAASTDVATAGDECPQWELTAAYADGSASGVELARAESHVAGCARCMSFVADLWSSGEATEGVMDPGRVERLLNRVVRRGRTAVVRWTSGAFSLVRGFAAELGEGVESALCGELATEGAVRGARSLSLRWTSGEVVVELEVRLLDEHPSLAGMITACGEPARDVSVALGEGATSRGPESPDAAGRFGPWPLSEGSNELRLSGGCLQEGRAELELELMGDGK